MGPSLFQSGEGLEELMGGACLPLRQVRVNGWGLPCSSQVRGLGGASLWVCVQTIVATPSESA